MRCTVCSTIQPFAPDRGGSGRSRKQRRLSNRDRCRNCGSIHLVHDSSETPPTMFRLSVADFEAAMDSTDWDPEEFDRLESRGTGFDVDIERVSTGEITPDEVPFDFNEADGHPRSPKPGDALIDELDDPLRHPQELPPLLKVWFDIEPPDLTSGSHAVRVAQFGLCLAGLMLLNAVLLLLMLF